MPKMYENGHKNVLGIWFDLVSKIKYSTILIFKVIFYIKSKTNLSDFFFIEEYKNGRDRSFKKIFFLLSLCQKRPFKYYVSMLLAFLGQPTHVSINSIVNQQKLHFLAQPTHLSDVILEWSQS